jgi:hypothetical protein
VINLEGWDSESWLRAVLGVVVGWFRVEPTSPGFDFYSITVPEAASERPRARLVERDRE